MDDTTILILISTSMIILSLIIVMAMSFKWILFGLTITFKRFQSKNNTGLYFLRSKSGNFTLPKVVDLNKNEETFKVAGKDVVLPINREDFAQTGLFFGMPYKMSNVEDLKTSIGLHYTSTDEKGNVIYNADGTPAISVIKNSVSVSGAMIKALIDEKALTDALKDFLQKNQLILILIVANIIVAGVTAYFSYEMMSNVLPTMESLVRGAIDSINNKLDLIIERVS